MRTLLALALVFCTFIVTEPAHARGSVYVGINAGGYYPHYYSGYYSSYYYPPPYYAAYGVPYYAPPVVYAAPPTTVVYTAPRALAADQTSPTYTDNYGRTCRQYSSPASNGTACLQPDGTWRVTP